MALHVYQRHRLKRQERGRGIQVRATQAGARSSRARTLGPTVAAQQKQAGAYTEVTRESAAHTTPVHCPVHGLSPVQPLKLARSAVCSASSARAARPSSHMSAPVYPFLVSPSFSVCERRHTSKPVLPCVCRTAQQVSCSHWVAPALKL